MIDTQAIRKKILDLALRGKLTEQLPEDGTAVELYQRIQQEKSFQKKAGKRKNDEPDASSAQRDIPFELPSSWMWVEIGEIFTLQAGKNITADRIADKQSDLYSYPCYGGNGLRGFVEQYNTSGLHALIGRQGALCGNINFAEGDFYATEHAVVVDVYAETDTIWAGLFLRALNLNQYATSVAQPGLAVNRIEKVRIPLPPILEQKRIVEKIESSYSVLDTIDTLQSQYQDNLATLKSKIIDAGIQGKLTEQLPEDGTAEELYQQIQQEKLALEKAGKIKKSKPLPPVTEEEKQFDIPDSWKWVRFDAISNILGTGMIRAGNEQYKEAEYYYFKMNNIGNFDGKCHFENMVMVNASKEEFDRYKLEEDDFLFNTRNSKELVGKTAVVPPISQPIILNNNILKIHFLGGIVPKYINYYFLSTQGHTRLSSFVTSTTNVAAIYQRQLITFSVPLPPLAEQKRIVAKLEELLPLCEG